MTKTAVMSTEATVPPPAVWAQRSEVIFLTLNIECSEPVYKFTDDSMVFNGVGMPEGKKYELNINFFSKINPEKVSVKNIKRCIEFVIAKAEPEDTYWPRLLKENTKPHWLKVDFNRWEDEDSGDDDGGADKMDIMEMLGNSQNKNKLSFDDLSDEQEDSDDESIPGLTDS
uniref:Putative hsp90 co-chaperone p23 n=1 Tax=Anopheles marajoara TaxID=58244 RepID=A0A2M4C1H4_9DIPT